MKGCRLETQTCKIKCVIDLPFLSSLKEVEEQLKTDGFMFAMILHDKDVKDDGELKIKHIHLVLRSPRRHQIAYYLNYLSDVFQKVNKINQLTTDGIEIMLSESFEWDLQYLIHKNDDSKYQYDVKDIVHNLNSNVFNEMMSLEVQHITSANDVLNCISNSKDRIELVCKLGIGTYNLYSKFIEDCIRSGYLGCNLCKR